MENAIKISIKLITLIKLLPFQKHLYYLNTTWLCALLNANADKSILVQNSPGYKTLYVSFLYKPLTCCKNFNIDQCIARDSCIKT
jgi:hypothetical protein